MNPLYLGTSERRIFGIYEPAAAKGPRTRAAVLCYPWGAEYVYAHRSMRQLAHRLSLSGYHTLRFDYFGTGDSAGDMSDADLSGWETDAEAAIEGIKDIAGTARVTLIGLRLGANVAASVAAQHSKEIDALVLWDPIISGEEYLQSLNVVSTPSSEGGGAAEVQGFPLTPRMFHDFKAIDVRAALAAQSSRSLVLITERLASHDSLGTVADVSHSNPVAVEFVAAPCPWVESVTTTGAVPVKAIRRIEEWLG